MKFNIPITNQKFYMVMFFYFFLILVFANLGKKIKQLGLTNGFYLGLLVSGLLWHFFGKSFSAVNNVE